MLAVWWSTGLRIGELRRLRWGDVDLDRVSPQSG
jgi:integrase